MSGAGSLARRAARRAARRVACLTTASLACLSAACGDRDVGTGNGAAYTQLYQALGRPAGLRIQGDTGVVVTVMAGKRETTQDRQVAARRTALTVAREWNTGRVRRVTTVFRRATRLGPFILRTHDDSVHVDDAGTTGAPNAPASPAAPAAPVVPGTSGVPGTTG